MIYSSQVLTVNYYNQSLLVLTSFRVLPEGGNFGHKGQGLLPGAGAQHHGVPDMDDLARPLHALITPAQHCGLLPLRHTQMHT